MPLRIASAWRPVASLVLALIAGQVALFAETSTPAATPTPAPAPALVAQVDRLMTELTVEEKILQLLSYTPNGVPRLGIPNLEWAELLHGVVTDGATSFPQAIAMGAMWNPELMEQIATVAAKEARAVGVGQAFTPMLGLARDPRWGRVEESYGEDPYLVTQLGVAYIFGMQGRGADQFGPDRVIATPKHFVADGEPWAGENGEDIELSDRVLREIYLPPFEAAIKVAHAGSIMPAHHAINGVPCHANAWLLGNLLRQEWGFQGFVTSDSGDIPKLFALSPDWAHRYATSPDDAAAKALNAGVDVELPGQVYPATLVHSLKTGAVKMETVDRAVRRVLMLKIRLLGLAATTANQAPLTQTQQTILGNKGPEDLFAKLVAEGKFTTPESARRSDFQKVLNDPAHDALALQAAEQAIVLLKNQNNLLPLDPAKLQNILVVGPLAVRPNLGGYSTGKPKFYVNVVDGLKAAVNGKVQVNYEQGCELENSSLDRLPAAVAAAAGAGVIVAVVGQTRDQAGENLDRDNLDLVGGQEKLVEAMQATGKPVVVILENGAPLTINWINEHVPAIVESWYLGQSAGTAIAKALLGEVNPGGKLSVSFPRNLGQIPCYYNHPVITGPVSFYGSQGGVLYPFGYGLSYTQFAYANLQISPANLHPVADATPPAEARVSLTVTNVGPRAGDEIVQMYIRQDYTSLKRPIKELKGFQRITLQPGEAKTVSFPLDWERLKFWKNGAWAVEPGNVIVQIGASSQDIRQAGILKLE